MQVAILSKTNSGMSIKEQQMVNSSFNQKSPGQTGFTDQMLRGGANMFDINASFNPPIYQQ